MPKDNSEPGSDGSTRSSTLEREIFGSSTAEPTRTLTSSQVDLGDDLIEKTRTLARERPAKDDVQSAKILFGEGLEEEAKRILRRILIGDPGNAPAKQLLEEIQAQELKQIFSGGPRRKRFTPERAEVELGEIDSEELMRGLDRDLELGLFSERTLEPELPLLKEPGALEALKEAMDREFHEAGARDRLDIGIGFLEMGMAELAERQFQAALKQCSGGPDPELALSSICLLGEAQLRRGRPIDAIETLRLAFVGTTVGHVELLYLMARAHEALGKREAAHAWYARAAQLEPGYRDVQERLTKTGSA